MFDTPPESPKVGVEVSAATSENVLPFPSVFENQGGDRDVERINQFEFYKLAGDLAELSNCRNDTPGGEIVFRFRRAQGAVNRLLEGNPLPLGVSHAAVEALKTQLDSMNEEHFSVVSADGKREFRVPSEDDPPVPAWRFNAWRRALVTFETVFGAEMAEVTSYYIPKRGI